MPQKRIYGCDVIVEEHMHNNTLFVKIQDLSNHGDYVFQIRNGNAELKEPENFRGDLIKPIEKYLRNQYRVENILV